jgi:eukaryotic-like serine/threonine-protein kinase
LMGLAGNLLAGRYRLDEPIGRGGFSEVWRASDTVLARPVAVKLLRCVRDFARKQWPPSGAVRLMS